MSFSIQRAVSDGTLDTIVLSIEYFDKTDISVFVDDVLLPDGTYTWAWDGLDIKITPAVANGSEVLVRRTTKFDDMYHNFDDGAVFNDTTMDDNFRQLLFIFQEGVEGLTATDFYADLNLHGYRLRKVGNAVEPDDAVPYSQYIADALGAGQFRLLAEAAANAADISEANSLASANASAASAVTSGNYATDSQNSATASAASAVTADNHRIAAGNSATAAAASAVTAGTHETNAGNSATSAAASAAAAAASAASINDANIVHLTGTETITGAKTFSLPVTGATPTAATHLATKGYVDEVTQLYRNRVINGAFDIWQRGTSTSTAGAFAADRWLSQNIGNTFTTSRQTFTMGQTDVPFDPKYFHRTVVTSVANAAYFTTVSHRIEGVRTFAGKQVTISFYAKADASKNIAIELEQYFGSGGSPSAVVTGISPTKVLLSSTWARYSVTVTLPSIAGKTLGTDEKDYLGVNIWLNAGSSFNARTATLGQQSGTFDFSCVQIEEGAVMSSFEYRPPAVELQMCLRFYERIRMVFLPAAELSRAIWYNYRAPKIGSVGVTYTYDSGGTSGGVAAENTALIQNIAHSVLTNGAALVSCEL